MTLPNRACVLVVMCAGMFLVLLDVTVTNIALPSMVSDLDVGTATMQWIVTAYTVTFAGVLLAGGALGDVYGQRRLVVIGLAVFGASSAACALSESGATLIVARAVQ